MFDVRRTFPSAGLFAMRGLAFLSKPLKPSDPIRGTPLNARNALLAVTLTLSATLVSCGSARRAGKDIFITAASPVLVVYGGATDGFDSARSVRTGLDSGSAVEVLAFPFTFLYHAVEHTIYCGIHLLDLPLTPLYAMTELPPASTPVEPLDFYQGTWFDEAPKGSGTDATSGESVPPGYQR